VQRRPDVLLWGAGMAASIHGGACQSLEWPVRAVASRRAEQAAQLARTLRAGTVTQDEALRDRVADLAIVTTPPACHADDAARLLDAGYQVVVETPVSRTLAEADLLIAAEQRHGRPVLYSEHLASSPAVDGLLSKITALGPLTHISARALQPPPTWRGSAPGAADRWGGGALFDLGVHPVALVLRAAAVSGLDAPTSVTAAVTGMATPREHAMLRLHFGSGPTANVTVAWRPDGPPEGDLQVSSASGVLRVDLYPHPTLEYNGDRVAIESSRPSPTALVDDYGYAPQLRRFWSNIRTGRPVPTTSLFGRTVLDVIAAAHWSAGSGAVEVPVPFDGPRDRAPIELWRAAGSS
jgi:predicted dehydrogenase